MPGIEEPVPEAAYIVVGVVLRADDGKEKLVVTPDGRHDSADGTAALVAFQERCFAGRVEVVAREGKRPTRNDGEMPMAD